VKAQQGLAAPGRSRMLKKVPVYPITSVLALLVVWQIVGSHINPIFLSTPVKVGQAVGALSSHASVGTLWTNAFLTLWTFLAGLLAGMVLGTPLGIAMGRYRLLAQILDVQVRIAYCIPVIALFPLFILWFGTGVPLRMPVIFLSAFLPAIINAEAGVVSVDATLIEVGRIFGATEWELFRKIIVPSTAPFIAAGFQQAIGRALVTTVGVELLTSQTGLGGLMDYYGNQLQTAYYFAPLVIVAIAGLLVYWAGDRVERHFANWRPTN
jgi:ABC-type nitrate/sulfonate/bicarbonate transport system permease component